MSTRELQYVRSPNLIAYWAKGRFTLDEFARRKRIAASPIAAVVLDLFETPRTVAWAVKQLPAFSPPSVRREINRLARLGFLVNASDIAAQRDIALQWQGSLAAAFFHCSTRNLAYCRDPAESRDHFRRKLKAAPQPSIYKRYPRARRVELPSATSLACDMTLHRALERRRTTRDFAARPVDFAALAEVIRRTFGQTGWIDGGILGKLLAKTSPSAGARHPIECYVLAWRVDGLKPGLYHYSVADDSLELLAKGDHRRLAAAIAGSQQWITRAAFLCVMTVVVQRGFWKYSSADAYRNFLLDAGHLAQTFVLLATNLGLGAFTTAALSERRIELLLGIDGVAELPIYLCGAGCLRTERPEAVSLFGARTSRSGS